MPHNRRERRAELRQMGKHDDSLRTSIPLAQPSRTTAKGKTLLEIASERELVPPSSTSPSITTTHINPDGTLSTTQGHTVDSTDYLEVLLYTASLVLLHLTLTLLVENQYSSTPPTLSSLPSRIFDTSIASPQPYVLLVLVAILHPRSAAAATQLLFAAMSVMCGVWLVHTTNRDPYLAAMARAPSLGTLWVWSVVELRWEVAVVTVAAVGIWAWLKGHGFS